MKIKSLLLFIIMCFIMLLVPSAVLGANKVETYTDDIDGNTYELFDDNTARVTLVRKSMGDASAIPSSVIGSDGENYVVTSISANALDDITEKQDLHLYPITAPELETNDSGEFFKNINAIYVPLSIAYIPELNAQGYTEANGWPKDKTKNYVITEQPVALTEVTAGAITSNDTLSVRFTMPVSAGSLQYAWYYCDKNGNIIDKENCISTEPDLQIPTDLAYDNENNTSKDYYFRCIVGDSVNIQEYSNIAKVTVKPGTYKVSFYYSAFSPETLGPVVLSVNSERRLSADDITKIPTETKLEQYKEGAKFVGWTPDGGVTIFDIDEISTKIFDKNMELYPVWKTKINFDANGGKFADGSTIFTTYISNFGTLDDEVLEPIIEDDEFLGFFYEKTGGEPYWGDQLKEETTVYAQWKLYKATGSGGIAEKQPEIMPEPELGEKDDTPKTGNDMLAGRNIIMLFAVISIIFSIIKLSKNN